MMTLHGKQAELIAIPVIFPILTILLVAFRLRARVITREPYKANDYFIVVAKVRLKNIPAILTTNVSGNYGHRECRLRDRRFHRLPRRRWLFRGSDRIVGEGSSSSSLCTSSLLSRKNEPCYRVIIVQCPSGLVDY